MQHLKPKVLMFGWEFPPFNSGGLGVACYGLTRSLVNLGADIVFVLPKNTGVNSDFLNIKFADTIRCKLDKEIKFKEFNIFLYPYLTAMSYRERREKLKSLMQAENGQYANDLYGEVMRYAVLSRNIARYENYDLIHAHDWLAYPAGIEAKKISGKQLIAHVHATEFDRAGGQGVHEGVCQVEKEGLEQADKVITVSNLVKTTVTERYGIDPDKVEVIHNGIDEDYFCERNVQKKNRLDFIKKAGYKLVLFLGRITIQKGPDYFIQVAKKVLTYEPKVYFLIVGSGDMQEEIMRQAADLRISDKILFAGWLRGEELAQAYQAADLYVMPSVSEPFGLTPLEAMINNTPVIVSKQSGVSEVAKNILKVDFWDIDEMANKIFSVLAYDSLHECLRVNGRAEVKELGWLQPAKKCLNLYQRLIFNTV